MPDFNRDACQKRNRIAAKRDGINSAPLKLFRQDDVPAPYDAGNLAAYGTLPRTEATALAKINELRTGGESLTAEQVWVHYAEAANDSFISDRYMFLDRSTLRNIARDAERGFAFMNSHRTGSMSHPTELPFGRTFGGRYEEQDGRKRCTVGLYMLRGMQPNGDSGPSTDDLHAMIDGGTIFDVSVGLYGGHFLCDVCGEDLEAIADGDYLCPHYPGTSYGMTPAEQKAQKARGVTDGAASYSAVDCGCSEISSVYDGAVPGAGFRKALSLCRSGRADEATTLQVRRAYRGLLTARDELSPELESVEGPEPGAYRQPFADHSQSVLTAVSELAERAEDYAALRERKDRPLSSERRAEFERIHAALGRILAADGLPAKAAERVRALREFALRHNAAA